MRPPDVELALIRLAIRAPWVWTGALLGTLVLGLVRSGPASSLAAAGLASAAGLALLAQVDGPLTRLPATRSVRVEARTLILAAVIGGLAGTSWGRTGIAELLSWIHMGCWATACAAACSSARLRLVGLASFGWLAPSVLEGGWATLFPGQGGPAPTALASGALLVAALLVRDRRSG